MHILRIFLALFLFLITLPLTMILFILVKLTSKGPFLFKQERLGKNKKPFTIYKIRTMVNNADKLKSRIKKLNEAKGPVFKVRNDPRFTNIGKFLSHTGLDELPQLINILKGDMTFVGPRPLPKEEALKVPKKFNKRFLTLPGITSTWVIEGGHKLTFDQWMRLDLAYINNESIMTDLKIFTLSVIKVLKILIKELFNEKK